MLKEHEKLELKQMQNMAIAMRFAQAKFKDFMSFISKGNEAGNIKQKGLTGYQYFKMKKGKR